MHPAATTLLEHLEEQVDVAATGGAAAFDGVDQGRQVVDEQVDAGQRGAGRSQPGQVGGAVCRERRVAVDDGAVDHPDQPQAPVEGLLGDHRADAGERAEDGQAAAAAVEGVDVGGRLAGPGGRTHRDGAQGLGLARAGGAEDEQVAVLGVVDDERLLGLLGRAVDEADDDLAVAATVRRTARRRRW